MKKNTTNWILFGAFALLLTLFIIWQISEQIFMINEVFALIILAVSPILNHYIFPKFQIVLLFVLLIPLFGFLQYSYSFVEANTTYTYHSGKFTGISPVVFIIMVIYIIVNISAIKKAFRLFRHGSDAEQTEKYDKMSQF
ncbi:putative membrane protein [Mucilaginibacter sp. UYNi724]